MPRVRWWSLGGGLGAVGAIVVAVLLLDRPAAFFAHDMFHRGPAFVALTHLVDPLLPAALVGFLGIGTARLLGWQPPRPVRVAFAIAIATLLAVVTKDQLKFAFGRTWPETWVDNNPSLIHDGVMIFAPFHGRIGWTSFPSGHMALATAPVAALVLLLHAPWRWAGLALPALVGLGLFGANFHYLSDMLAGTLVGLLCATIAVQLLRPGIDAP